MFQNHFLMSFNLNYFLLYFKPCINHSKHPAQLTVKITVLDHDANSFSFEMKNHVTSHRRRKGWKIDFRKKRKGKLGSQMSFAIASGIRNRFKNFFFLLFILFPRIWIVFWNLSSSSKVSKKHLPLPLHL